MAKDRYGRFGYEFAFKTFLYEFVNIEGTHLLFEFLDN